MVKVVVTTSSVTPHGKGTSLAAIVSMCPKTSDHGIILESTGSHLISSKIESGSEGALVIEHDHIPLETYL